GAAVVAPGEAPPATAQTPTQSPPPAQQPVTSVPSRRVTAIAWWKRRGRTAQVGLVLGAIVLLLIPLSALGSSGDSKHVAIKPIQSPPSATTNVPPPSSTTASVAGAEPLTVARVVDGDTVKLSDGRTVQLAQISAPSVASGGCHAN